MHQALQQVHIFSIIKWQYAFHNYLHNSSTTLLLIGWVDQLRESQHCRNILSVKVPTVTQSMSILCRIISDTISRNNKRYLFAQIINASYSPSPVVGMNYSKLEIAKIGNHSYKINRPNHLTFHISLSH